MRLIKSVTACLAAGCMVAATPALSEGFPKLPKLPKIEKPKLPKLPTIKKPKIPSLPAGSPRLPSVAGVPTSAVGGSASGSSLDANAYMQDVMLVARGIDLMGAGDTPENDARIDDQIEVYVATIDRLVEDNYTGVDPHMKSSLSRQMKQYFEKQAKDVPADIGWMKEVVFNYGLDDPGTGRRMFNWLSVKRANLRAGDALFPGSSTYSKASKTLEAFIGSATSRDNAMAAMLSKAGEQAAKVAMPPATKNDPGLVRMFQTAYGTSGIDWEIIKINPRGGWSVKRNAAGRKIGDLHSAAIASRSPKDSNRCRLYNFTLIKDSSGSVRRNTHSSQMIACENVK